MKPPTEVIVIHDSCQFLSQEPEPDYDILGDDLDETNPDVISCGAESQRRRKPLHYSNKTLRGAFVKRYNALSKRSNRNKPKTQRPGIAQVFDNVGYQDNIWNPLKWTWHTFSSKPVVSFKGNVLLHYQYPRQKYTIHEWIWHHLKILFDQWK